MIEREEIVSELKKLETAKGVRTLYACESGSRAWGFPSPDSDYDVRLIFSRPKARYLSISEEKETLEIPISGLLDIGGWDLRKALRLLYKSNAAVFEWLQSPVIYSEALEIRSRLWELAPRYFAPRALVHHYLGVARGALATGYQGEQIKIKKCFYVLRPLLAAKWIVERREIPPMEFGRLLEITANETDLTDEIRRLLEQKKRTLESETVAMPQRIRAFIEREQKQSGALAAELSAPAPAPDVRPLDDLFRAILDETETNA